MMKIHAILAATVIQILKPIMHNIQTLIDSADRHSDDYGREIYYQVGERRTSSKILALEWAQGDIDQVTFHWRENEFDQIDWTTEPVETLDTLVDLKVQNIRAMNDHVAIWYSGGFDSHTIVEAFYRNNLKVDELIIFDRDWYNGSSEIEATLAMEFAKKIKKDFWPSLMITRIRWKANDVLHFYRHRGLDWIYHSGACLRFSKHSRNLVWQTNKDVIDLATRPGRSIQINGIDKPCLDFYNGSWFARKNDSANVFYAEMDDPCMQFWYDPSLYVKQCWMMIHWLENLPGVNRENLHGTLHDVQSFNTSHLMYEQWNLAIGRSHVWNDFMRGFITKHMKNPTRHSPDSQELQRVTQVDHADVWRIYDHALSWVENKFKHLFADSGTLPTICGKPYFVSHYGQTLKRKETQL